RRREHVWHAPLVGLAADEASPVEVLGGRPIDERRLVRYVLPVLVESLEPERHPPRTGLEEAHSELREAMEHPPTVKHVSASMAPTGCVNACTVRIESRRSITNGT